MTRTDKTPTIEKADREIRSALITGATGMIGATLTRVLLREGVRVTAVIRPGSHKRRNLPEGAEGLTIVECALSELSALSLPDRYDAFYHFAWEGTYGKSRDNEELQEKNVQAALSALRLAKELGAKVFIGAGSQAEYGPTEMKLTPQTPCRPETGYGKGKLKTCLFGKELARELGIDFIWTRLLSVYGPFDNDYTLIASAIRSLKDEGIFPATKGEQVWDYLFSGDAAEWYYRLAKSGRDQQIYVLSGGEQRTLRSYLETLQKIVNPEGEIRFGALPYREHQVMTLSGDIRLTVQDTDYSPKTDFGEGIQKTLDWMLQAQKAGRP